MVRYGLLLVVVEGSATNISAKKEERKEEMNSFSLVLTLG